MKLNIETINDTWLNKDIYEELHNRFVDLWEFLSQHPECDYNDFFFYKEQYHKNKLDDVDILIDATYNHMDYACFISKKLGGEGIRDCAHCPIKAFHNKYESYGCRCEGSPLGDYRGAANYTSKSAYAKNVSKLEWRDYEEVIRL